MNKFLLVLPLLTACTVAGEVTDSTEQPVVPKVFGVRDASYATNPWYWEGFPGSKYLNPTGNYQWENHANETVTVKAWANYSGGHRPIWGATAGASEGGVEHFTFMPGEYSVVFVWCKGTQQPLVSGECAWNPVLTQQTRGQPVVRTQVLKYTPPYYPEYDRPLPGNITYMAPARVTVWNMSDYDLHLGAWVSHRDGSQERFVDENVGAGYRQPYYAPGDESQGESSIFVWCWTNQYPHVTGYGWETDGYCSDAP